MSACPIILPWIHADFERQLPVLAPARPRQPDPPEPLEPEVAFYRKYTEALLRRYVRMSMLAGRVPSLLGQEMFRAKVTHYRMESFEDVVIFIHDIARSLQKLNPEQQRLITHIMLQDYTVLETATMLQMDPRMVVNRYRGAIDRLTSIFLRVKILQPQNRCQEANSVDNSPTDSIQTSSRNENRCI